MMKQVDQKKPPVGRSVVLGLSSFFQIVLNLIIYWFCFMHHLKTSV